MQDHVNHARLGQRLAALMSRAVRDVAVEGLDPVVRLFDLVGRRWLLGAGTPPAGFGEDGFVLCVAGSEHLLEGGWRYEPLALDAVGYVQDWVIDELDRTWPDSRLASRRERPFLHPVVVGGLEGWACGSEWVASIGDLERLG